MQYLSRIEARYNTLIEAIPFTTEEYRQLDRRTFLGAIVRKGKPYHPDSDSLHLTPFSTLDGNKTIALTFISVEDLRNCLMAEVDRQLSAGEPFFV